MFSRFDTLRAAAATKARRAVYYPWFLYKAWRLGRLKQALAEPEFCGQYDYSPASIRYTEAFLGGTNPLLEAPLGKDSIVLDVGAYDGAFAAAIRERYGSTVHCFEPNPDAYKLLERALGSGDKALLHPFGLAATNRRASLALDGWGSSVEASSPRYSKLRQADVELRDVVEVFETLGLSRIDLLKVNIEGGEYELFERLLDAGLQKRCRCIRIQFHRWLPHARRRREAIRRRLSATHTIEWDYPFVWEGWVRRE